MKFRSTEYKLKDINEIYENIPEETKKYAYPGGTIEYPGFKLDIDPGSFPATSSLNVILGINGSAVVLLRQRDKA